MAALPIPAPARKLEEKGILLNLLLLSPHRDDAAFSLTLSIARWLALGHRITIMNVFSRSSYAPFSDADTVHENDRLTYVSALRRREDESFARHMPGATPANLKFVDLNLKDAPIRLRCDPSSVCELAVDPNDTAFAKLQKSLATHLEGKGALVAPLGIGKHVDHRVVREAVLSFATDLPIAFYEDLPYAAETEDAGLREGLEPVLVDGMGSALRGRYAEPGEFKRRMVALYGSQIDAGQGEAIAGFCLRSGGAERLWANRAWVDAAEAGKLSVAERLPEKGQTLDILM